MGLAVAVAVGSGDADGLAVGLGWGVLEGVDRGAASPTGAAMGGPADGSVWQAHRVAATSKDRLKNHQIGVANCFMPPLYCRSWSAFPPGPVGRQPGGKGQPDGIFKDKALPAERFERCGGWVLFVWTGGFKGAAGGLQGKDLFLQIRHGFFQIRDPGF